MKFRRRGYRPRRRVVFKRRRVPARRRFGKRSGRRRLLVVGQRF